MSSEVLVKVESVSKKFCRSLKRSLWYGMEDMFVQLNPFQRNGVVGDSNQLLRTGEFWAVNNVSFELRRGECLGLVGCNGAGKTTLLKMLNGLIKPDAGRITMHGRVGALIALGAGFNPILTGRENIYVNGSVLGLTNKEIDAKIEEIIDFADVGNFIDTPVQSYSSGMQVRLGFAVATALEPDILLLDEVLAVGDAAFRNKCYRRIVALRKKAAVIFVSHNMDQVARVCDKTLVMSHGARVFLGTVDEGISFYEKLNDDGEDKDESFLSINHPIVAFTATVSKREIDSGSPLLLRLRVTSREKLEQFLLRIFFYNASGAFAADGTFSSHEYGMVLEKGLSVWGVRLDSVPLKRGRYRIAFNLIDPYGDLIIWSYKQHEICIKNTFAGAIADCQLSLRSWKVIRLLSLN